MPYIESTKHAKIFKFNEFQAENPILTVFLEPGGQFLSALSLAKISKN